MGQQGSNDTGEERRSGLRRPTGQEVCLFDENGWPIVLETLDLGPRGVFVCSDVVLEPGQELWVSFNVPDGPRIVVRGRVVRGHLGGDGQPPGMAIAFIDLTTREEGLLRRFTVEPAEHRTPWQAPFEPVEPRAIGAITAD